MPPADHIISYGDTNQIGELRMPPARAASDHRPRSRWLLDASGGQYLAAMGDTLKSDGIASWSIVPASGPGWRRLAGHVSRRGSRDRLPASLPWRKAGPIGCGARPLRGGTWRWGEHGSESPPGVRCSSLCDAHSRRDQSGRHHRHDANIAHREMCRGPVVATCWAEHRCRSGATKRPLRTRCCLRVTDLDLGRP